MDPHPLGARDYEANETQLELPQVNSLMHFLMLVKISALYRLDYPLSRKPTVTLFLSTTRNSEWAFNVMSFGYLGPSLESLRKCLHL